MKLLTIKLIMINLAEENRGKFTTEKERKKNKNKNNVLTAIAW